MASKVLREARIVPTPTEMRDRVEQEFARRFGLQQRTEREVERIQNE